MVERADIPAALRRPVALSADNFTPLARTPWGGDVIGQRYKHTVVAGAAGQKIGEAWEFSCDPAFPSKVAAQVGDGLAGLDLLTVIQRYPEAVLSPAGALAGKGQCELLVKLLDAAAPLSLQVHPADGDRHLQPGECGKPESWLVLAAKPGAGIYLGFSRAVSRDALRAALQNEAPIDQAKGLLHFATVVPGDYFEIEPGVPHAIGAGVTLLEPQRILPGMAGKTYRLWDWGRRYDAAGRLDPLQGLPRPLHLEESLPLVDPQKQIGPAFAASLKRRAHALPAAPGVTARSFPANVHYQTHLFDCAAGASLRLDVRGGYGALVMLSGALACKGADGLTLATGQPFLLPHAAMPLAFTATAATSFALVIPASASLGMQ